PSLPAHRHLHSSPTRRSSDLHIQVRIATPLCTGRSVRSQTRWKYWLAGSTASARSGPSCSDDQSSSEPTSTPPVKELRATPPARSEEHTSELQSRENLVCRLL